MHLIEKLKNLPFEKTGCWPVSCSNTLAALVNLSPDSPTQISTHNFLILKSLITFLVLSFGSFFSLRFFSTLAFFCTAFGFDAGAAAVFGFAGFKRKN